MATRTWETVELPILEAIIALENVLRSVTTVEIAKASGLPIVDVSPGLRRLFEAGYVTGGRQHMTGIPFDMIGVRALEPGRKATGQWPSDDPFAELLTVLQIRINAASDQDARGPLVRLRDTIADVGRDVVTGVLTAWATSVIPR